MSLTVLDLFSGIGGFSLGAERAGWHTVAFCEIDKFCTKILKKRWPEVPIFDDIKSLTSEEIYKKVDWKIDVICGGFPCQDISVAGKKAGITGSRSSLWKEFARLINEIKPKYAIIENVANLRGNGLITVLQDLWQIGYDAEWHCIPASAVGAPHRRDRIWIIAYPNSQRFSNNKSSLARTDDTQRCKECSEETSTSGICSATSGLSKNKTRDLADTDSSRQVEQCWSHSKIRKADSGRCNNGARSRENEPDLFKKEISNAVCEGLAGYSGNIREAGSQRQIIQYGQVSLIRCTRGVELWATEPAIPRLRDNGLNPDWVEWLMGFPIGWTEGGTRRNRLKSLGNAVVPVIPELIANSINNLKI